MNLITVLNKNHNYRLALAYVCRDLSYGQYCQGVPYPIQHDAYVMMQYLFSESIAQDNALSTELSQDLFVNTSSYPWPVGQMCD